MKKTIVLVTGGSRGIGRSICLSLAEHGCTILFTYLSNESKAQELRDEINQMGRGEAYGYRCDMSQLPEVLDLAKRIKRDVGYLDAIVNNAGIVGDGKPFLFATDEHWWHVIRTNVGSVTNTCRVLLPMMISRKAGRIINITSLSGQKGNAGQSAYSASKAAVVTFSRSLAKEVGRFGITVNCISPGLIDTDMTRDISNEYVANRLVWSPLKRKGGADEVANFVTYMICDAPGYIIGQELTIDGGLGVS
ncbi:3-oxoacyl-ACP reductase family protein [Spirosoma agri]|uniref:3-oxoacyl-ACP reductase FabG n=1 Tax=Spirosoma agri TaxID=1987381 RepID=A0A6M0IN52_9BACT|nr:3-oxoacyl-ACP reductase family protein [Spirosoma agri]NEU69756.1 3-oxoacyl-ACP reductase FabG [Spirosoma agri]